MKKSGLILLLSLIVLAIAVMIFLFSAQDGESSSKTSGTVTEFVVRLFVKDYDQLTVQEQRAIYHQYEPWVRKTAHFTEFFLLGFFLRLLLQTIRFRFPGWGSWLGGTLYAVTDELHQHFVSRRAAMWQDVCIDSAGVLLGMLLAMAFFALAARNRAQ